MPVNNQKVEIGKIQIDPGVRIPETKTAEQKETTLPKADRVAQRKLTPDADAFCEQAKEIFEKVISLTNTNNNGYLTSRELAVAVANFPRGVAEADRENVAVALCFLYEKLRPLKNGAVSIEPLRRRVEILSSKSTLKSLEKDYKDIEKKFRILSTASEELFPKGLDGIKPSAVQQGVAQNCIFKVALAGLAQQRPEVIQKAITEVDRGPSGSRQFEVNLPGKKQAITVVEPNLCEMISYRGSSENGYWPLVIEKAYGVHMQELYPDDKRGMHLPLAEYTPNRTHFLDLENFSQATEVLTGKKVKELVVPADNSLDERIESEIKAGNLVLFATADRGISSIVEQRNEAGELERTMTIDNIRNHGILPRHAYAAIEVYVDQAGKKRVVLMEPNQDVEATSVYADDVEFIDGEYRSVDENPEQDGFFAVPLDEMFRHFLIVGFEE